MHGSVSSVSHESEIILIYWFIAHETFIFIINAENSCATSCVFVETVIFRIFVVE